MANSGIYAITNTLNGHVYIGSAVNISQRWGQHTRHLNKNSHHSDYLQRAWDKYGADCFEFSVLEYCEAEWLLRWEQTFIDNEHPEYNVSPTAGSSLGVKHTDAAKHNMSLAGKGKHTPSIEARALMSAVLKGNTRCLGNTLTDEHKHNLSVAGKGKNKGNKNCLGRIVSEETRLKIGLANKLAWAKRKAAQMQPRLETA